MCAREHVMQLPIKFAASQGQRNSERPDKNSAKFPGCGTFELHVRLWRNVCPLRRAALLVRTLARLPNTGQLLQAFRAHEPSQPWVRRTAPILPACSDTTAAVFSSQRVRGGSRPPASAAWRKKASGSGPGTEQCEDAGLRHTPPSWKPAGGRACASQR